MIETPPPVPAAPAVGSRHAFWYCVVLVVIPLAAIVASLVVVRTDWFLPRSGNTYIPNVGYGASLHHADCQVVVTGDSSALVGVVPSVITRDTGLSACNIAEFGGMEQVNGRMILDEYLSQNARPRFIIFVYVPENISAHDTWTDVSHFEAILFRMRTHPDKEFLRAMLVHPKETLSFMTLSLRLVIQALIKKPLPAEAVHTRQLNLGWIAVPGSVLSTCIPGHATNPPDAAYIQSLRSRYATQETQVLIDVTPMPPCDPDYDYYVPRLKGIIDNQQQQYPVDLYNNSGRLHLILSGAERFSHELARQITEHQNSTH